MLVKDRLLPAIMLWCGGMDMDAITPPKSSIWVGKGKNPVALMRSNWTDTNAVYVAMKGGSVSVNHAHMGYWVFYYGSTRCTVGYGFWDAGI